MSDNAHQNPNSVKITTTDMPASLNFWVKLAGFTLKESWPNPENALWANLSLNGQALMLGVPMEKDKVNDYFQGEPEWATWCKEIAEEQNQHPTGVGLRLYFNVDNVDDYHRLFSENGGTPATPTRTQFYGIRDLGVRSPEGTRAHFFQHIKMEGCQSCGCPLVDAKAGEIYCEHCIDGQGNLESFDNILKACASWMEESKELEKSVALQTAAAYLKEQPAWSTCSLES